jgi:hypothetical protein
MAPFQCGFPLDHGYDLAIASRVGWDDRSITYEKIEAMTVGKT